MNRIAIYGKGGIGKSTVATALCSLQAGRGKKVLFVGCDPKHDASARLVDTFPVRTAMGAISQYGERQISVEQIVMHGRQGVDCIECGGPEPGVGCAGRGITKTFEVLARLGFDFQTYDTVVFDVLGDVVCGGFATILRPTFAQAVYIVVSAEIMSLFAANNICRAVERYASSGLALGGLIGNSREVPGEDRVLHAFAERLNTRLLVMLPRSDEFHRAERAGKSLVEFTPDAELIGRFELLADEMDRVKADRCPPPRPMGEVAFDEYIRTILFP
jgi:nitrogenase iron protein NifH